MSNQTVPVKKLGNSFLLWIGFGQSFGLSQPRHYGHARRRQVYPGFDTGESRFFKLFWILAPVPDHDPGFAGIAAVRRCVRIFLTYFFLSPVLVSLVLVPFLASCGGGEPPQPPAAVQQADKSAEPSKAKGGKPESDKKKVAAGEKIGEKEAESEGYSPKGVRDPFRPLLVPRKVQLEVRTIPLTPLQTYDTEALIVVGIVWGELGERALILAPDGREYFAKVGTLIGKNMGYIVGIEGKKVIVEEKVYDLLGKASLKRVILGLKREKEEG